MTTGQVISMLNDLIQTSLDGELFLRTAGEAAEDSELKGFFSEYADERAAFTAELEREVERLGGTPEPPGPVAGHAGTREVIEGQYHSIRRAHDHLRSLRHGRRAA